jgi:hypothetical protein
MSSAASVLTEKWVGVAAVPVGRRESLQATGSPSGKPHRGACLVRLCLCLWFYCAQSLDGTKREGRDIGRSRAGTFLGCDIPKAL